MVLVFAKVRYPITLWCEIPAVRDGAVWTASRLMHATALMFCDLVRYALPVPAPCHAYAAG